MKQDAYIHNFKNKKVTKMGLGPNGRSFGDTIFLLKNGAQVLVTDHRDAPDIHVSKEKLLAELTTEEQSRVSFVLGEHREKDFTSCDFVLKASGVPLNNKYVEAAQSVGAPVYTSSAWLFELIKQSKITVRTIGVTGTKGKSTTTDMIEHILKTNKISYHVAGNIRGVSNLPVLAEIEDGDVLLAELDSWQLQGFGEMNISPHISVFTNFFEDHLNYYGGSMELYFKDKSYIYKNQQDVDVCLVSKQAYSQINHYENVVPETVIDVAPSVLPQDIKLNTLGDHNKENAALAYSVAQQLGLGRDPILSSLESYMPMEGRLRNLGEHAKIFYYDDNNSTTPTSTLKSLQSIKEAHPESRIIWFGGGADKEFDYTGLANNLEVLVDGGILFAGTATDKIIELIGPDTEQSLRVVDSMESAWEHVDTIKQEGDVIILSPGAASFGVFLNEYERGDGFNTHVKNILGT